MDPKVTALRDQVRGETQQLDLLQKELNKLQEARSHLIQQQQENVMVLEELKLLEDEAVVYKLIGSALIKQDPVEAKSNVEKRLEFINHDLSRLESQAKNVDEKRTQKRSQMMRLQEQIQRLQQPIAQ